MVDNNVYDKSARPVNIDVSSDVTFASMMIRKGHYEKMTHGSGLYKLCYQIRKLPKMRNRLHLWSNVILSLKCGYTDNGRKRPRIQKKIRQMDIGILVSPYSLCTRFKLSSFLAMLGLRFENFEVWNSEYIHVQKKESFLSYFLGAYQKRRKSNNDYLFYYRRIMKMFEKLRF